jgi:hypothetical protein
VQFTVFHVELEIAVGRNFAAVHVSILLLLSVCDCLMLQQQLFKRQGCRELCACGVASSD